jgi:hypothetical protein
MLPCFQTTPNCLRRRESSLIHMVRDNPDCQVDPMKRVTQKLFIVFLDFDVDGLTVEHYWDGMKMINKALESTDTDQLIRELEANTNRR